MSITSATVTEDCVLTCYGVLDGSTYLKLRDAVINAALAEPRSVIIDVTGLTFLEPSALLAFTNAQSHIAHWPAIPMALVCGSVKSQKMLRTSAIGSHIPIYWTVHAAVTALTGNGGLSRLGRAHLPPDT